MFTLKTFVYASLAPYEVQKSNPNVLPCLLEVVLHLVHVPPPHLLHGGDGHHKVSLNYTLTQYLHHIPLHVWFAPQLCCN